MRLLHTTTHRLAIKDPSQTKYAILSHRWGEKELLYAQIANADKKASWKRKTYASKVLKACARAKADGHEYIWIDNCCKQVCNLHRVRQRVPA